MEQQANQANQQKKGGGLASLLGLIPIILGIIYLLSALGVTGGSTARKEAEKYVQHDVYVSLGVVPETTRSEIIYHKGSKRLIEVEYALTGTNWNGTYCVYTDGKTVRNSTTMMGPGYNFKEHLNEVKALFGI